MTLRFSYLATQGSSSHELLDACVLKVSMESSLASKPWGSSSELKSSHGRKWRWCIPCRTTHMPFQAAINVEIPMKNPMIEMTRQARLAVLRVRRIATRRPATMPPIPRPRAKITRDRLPLQMVQRIKLGWAWQRRDHSTVDITSLKAEGWVVFWSAWRSAERSLDDKFSCREPPSAM